MNLKIERKETKTIPASEMEVGQVARIVSLYYKGHLIERKPNGYWLAHRDEDREGKLIGSEITVEPVQTISTTPKTITPAEMEDGQIGEIVEVVNDCCIDYKHKIVKAIGNKLHDVEGKEFARWIDRRGITAFKIRPLQSGDKIVIE